LTQNLSNGSALSAICATKKQVFPAGAVNELYLARCKYKKGPLLNFFFICKQKNKRKISPI
jgi:hypothetical protein